MSEYEWCLVPVRSNAFLLDFTAFLFGSFQIHINQPYPSQSSSRLEPSATTVTETHTETEEGVHTNHPLPLPLSPLSTDECRNQEAFECDFEGVAQKISTVRLLQTTNT